MNPALEQAQDIVRRQHQELENGRIHLPTTGSIVICGQCRGSGIIQTAERYDPIEDEEQRIEGYCPRCKGTGRMRIEQTTTFEPFKFFKPRNL